MKITYSVLFVLCTSLSAGDLIDTTDLPTLLWIKGEINNMCCIAGVGNEKRADFLSKFENGPMKKLTLQADGELEDCSEFIEATNAFFDNESPNTIPPLAVDSWKYVVAHLLLPTPSPKDIAFEPCEFKDSFEAYNKEKRSESPFGDPFAAKEPPLKDPFCSFDVATTSKVPKDRRGSQPSVYVAMRGEGSPTARVGLPPLKGLRISDTKHDLSPVKESISQELHDEA